MERIRSEFFRFVKFAAVAVIIVYVIQKNGGVKMVETMAGARWSWAGLSALSFFLSIVLGSCQWYLLLRLQGVRFSLVRCFKVYYMGMFANALVFPMAGDAMRIYKLKKGDVQITTGFAATFMDRFMGLFVLSVFSLIAVAGIWLHGQLNENTIKLIFYASLLVFLGFAFGISALVSRRMGKVFQLMFQMMELKKVENLYENIRLSMAVYRRQWKGMLVVSLISSVVHTLRILGHCFCAPALGIDISPIYFFAFIPIITITTLIPLNVGGWGLPQGIGTTLYSLAGVIRGVEGVSVLGIDAVRLASGSLTFLPSIIFYIIMLMGGFFLFSGMRDPKRE
jgi:uncharacterized protein (TIRG00374 family)